MRPPPPRKHHQRPLLRCPTRHPLLQNRVKRRRLWSFHSRLRRLKGRMQHLFLGTSRTSFRPYEIWCGQAQGDRPVTSNKHGRPRIEIARRVQRSSARAHIHARARAKQATVLAGTTVWTRPMDRSSQQKNTRWRNGEAHHFFRYFLHAHCITRTHSYLFLLLVVKPILMQFHAIPCAVSESARHVSN
jgi:hypothetical protein